VAWAGVRPRRYVSCPWYRHYRDEIPLPDFGDPPSKSMTGVGGLLEVSGVGDCKHFEVDTAKTLVVSDGWGGGCRMGSPSRYDFSSFGPVGFRGIISPGKHYTMPGGGSSSD
jgi:hypothetical protein